MHSDSWKAVDQNRRCGSLREAYICAAVLAEVLSRGLAPLRADLERSNFLDSQAPMLKGSLGSACRGPELVRSWCFSRAASSCARAPSCFACDTCSWT